MRKLLCICSTMAVLLVGVHFSWASVVEVEAPPVVTKRVKVEAQPIMVNRVQEDTSSADAAEPAPKENSASEAPKLKPMNLNWSETSYSDSFPVTNSDQRNSIIDQEMNRMNEEQKSDEPKVEPPSQPKAAANAPVEKPEVPANIRTKMEKTESATDKDLEFDNKPHIPKMMSTGDSTKPLIADKESVKTIQRQDYAITHNKDYYSVIPITHDTELNVPERQFELGTEISHISYKEPIFDLEDKGIMYGIFGAMTFHPPEETKFHELLSMIKLDGKFSFGMVDYESTSGTLEDIPDYMMELRVVTGKDFYMGRSSMITPYFGFGYRYLNDDSSGKTTSTGASGYERTANYYYLPIGVEIQHKLADGWFIVPNAEYDVLLTGDQRTYLSDIPGYPDLQNRQREGYGMRGSLKFVKETEGINYLIQPFIRYWHFEDSDSSTAVGSVFIITGLEPENTSTEYGVKLGVQF